MARRRTTISKNPRVDGRGRLDRMNTHDVLTRAAGHLVASGVENLNDEVDPLFDGGALQRVIAQVDVCFSNSLIEAWWRSLKHRWLFLHPLNNIATVKRLVEFYVTEHTSESPTARWKARHPTRCTSVAVLRSPMTSPSGDASQQRVVRNREVACAACLRVRRCRAGTSPHEAYAGFAGELPRTQLHRFTSRRFDTIAPRRIFGRHGRRRPAARTLRARALSTRSLTVAASAKTSASSPSSPASQTRSPQGPKPRRRRRVDDPRGAVVPEKPVRLGGAGLPARGRGRARRRLGELRGGAETQPLVGAINELLQRGTVGHSVE